jgi:membrane protease YdiL (CAAX protease family)
VSVGVAALTWFVTLFAGYAITLVAFAAGGIANLSSEELPAWASVVSVSALWIPQIVGLRYVSKKFGAGSWREDFGLRFRPTDLAGVPIGILSQLVLLELVYWPLRTAFPDSFDRQLVEEPARNLFDRAAGGWKVALIVVVCLGAPIVEELLYRGLIFRSIEGRITAGLAVAASALWFAAAHVQAVQLPGLFVFGVVLAWCAHRTGRLGMSMFAHAAFNATTVALLLLPGFEGFLR